MVRPVVAPEGGRWHGGRDDGALTNAGQANGGEVGQGEVATEAEIHAEEYELGRRGRDLVQDLDGLERGQLQADHRQR